MEIIITVHEEYLRIPVQIGKAEHLLEIFEEEDEKLIKLTEFMIPAGETEGWDYLAYIPVKAYRDKRLVLRGEMSEHFWKEVKPTSSKEAGSTAILERPAIHFTAQTGWINDPNGLVYADGIYHLYFQYNPFNISWNNMSWGHATSCDLLHWEQQDTVLWPDENGLAFSGSSIINERGLLGLPKEALLFFYTAASEGSKWYKEKSFTQRIAYSLDGGISLIKLKEACLETICQENRDPKVFWYEESKAYIMALWLEKNDFALFRSEDLKEWKMSDRFTLEGAWECPDLLEVTAADGQKEWMFWSADGFYYWGEFDGYQFITDGIRHSAYINKVPYAAQTFSGVRGRMISIPWLRTKNDGRFFTGAMGIPRELSMREIDGEKYLIQQPIREINEQRRSIGTEMELKGDIFEYCSVDQKAVQLEIVLEEESTEISKWQFNGSTVSYDPVAGRFCIEEETYEIGKEKRIFNFIIDDRILEVTVNHGIMTGMFELKENLINILVNLKQVKHLEAYEIS